MGKRSVIEMEVGKRSVIDMEVGKRSVIEMEVGKMSVIEMIPLLEIEAKLMTLIFPLLR